MSNQKIEILNKKLNGFLTALKNVSKEFKKSKSLEDKFSLLSELSKHEQFLIDSGSDIVPNNWKLLDLFKNKKSNEKIIQCTLDFYIDQKTFDIQTFIYAIKNIMSDNTIESMIFIDILFENANIECDYNQYIKLDNNEKSILSESILNHMKETIINNEITSISFNEDF